MKDGFRGMVGLRNGGLNVGEANGEGDGFVDLPPPVLRGGSEQIDDSRLSRSSSITLLLAAGKDGGAGWESIIFTNVASVFCISSTLISS